MNRTPSIFISHGPPGIAVSNTPAGDFLRSLGRQLPRPRAILSISAHWETVWPMVTASRQPGIIHDFAGPLTALKLEYGVTGAPDIAMRVVDILRENNMKAEGDATRGVDHGTWIPLLMMYPEADIPVVQLSIQTEESSGFHFELGRALAPLAKAGVLIMASGGAVHNLEELRTEAVDAPVPRYVRAFDAWLEERVIAGDVDALLHYRSAGPDAERCHPYPAEHFLPLFVALGVKNGVGGRPLHKSFMYGTLSMAAYAWG